MERDSKSLARPIPDQERGEVMITSLQTKLDTAIETKEEALGECVGLHRVASFASEVRQQCHLNNEFSASPLGGTLHTCN